MDSLPRIGVDIVDCDRFRTIAARGHKAFFQRVFTEDERALCEAMADPAPHFAARFAAKEAVAKTFGTGIGASAGLREIEVVRTPGHAPEIVLHGAAAATAAKLGIRAIRLSLSHTRGQAVAMVLAC